MATTIPKNADGGIYITKSTLKPGEIVDLTGDYSYIYVDVLAGTAATPIVFRNKGNVNIGVNKPINYALNLQGKHFKFIAEGGKVKVGNQSKHIGIGVSLGNSTNYTLEGLEVFNCADAFFSNPKTGTEMKMCRFIGNYVHDLTNPPTTANPVTTGPEAFYLGNTQAPGARFTECVIEDNIIDGTDGDGIQVCNGEFKIKGNTIKNFARLSKSSHRNGIIVGTLCSAQILENIIQDGKGVALTILGGGYMMVGNNKFTNIDTSGFNEDAIYIDGRDGNLELDFNGNTFSNIKVGAGKKIIGNYTTKLPQVVSYRGNIGLKKTDVKLLASDEFYEDVQPIDPPPPPIPERVIVARLFVAGMEAIIYSDKTADVK